MKWWLPSCCAKWEVGLALGGDAHLGAMLAERCVHGQRGCCPPPLSVSWQVGIHPHVSMSGGDLTTGSGHGIRSWPWLAASARRCDVGLPLLCSRHLVDLCSFFSCVCFDVKLVPTVVLPSLLLSLGPLLVALPAMV
jgi:hypothetical protein